MKIKIVRLMVATCVCVAALTQGTAVFAGNTKTQYEAPPIVWESCGFPFECATVDVPLDHGYDGPQSMVSIALARVPATDPDNRIGSLFINPGGPGGSGVNFVFNIGTVLYTDEVRARFDIVGFDPRGIGRSDGLKCFRSPEQLDTVLKSTPFPVTDEEFREFRRKDWRFANLCRRQGGEIQDFMTTADVARDLDLLRQAVGDEQLNYAGFSYGSYIGVTYANLFPQRVGALIVDAVLDPIAWSTGRRLERFTTPVSARLGSQDGTYETVEQFLELCDSAGEACAFSGNSAERYAALAERLKAQPLEIQLPDGTIVNLTYAIAVNETRIAMYNPFSWPSFAELLALVESFASAAEIGAAVAQFHREKRFRVSNSKQY